MPKLTIDHRSIEVIAGTKVIEAAAQLGIVIPRFCYHPALGSVGACRVCAVKILEGPQEGIQMSCMLDAVDGMVVSTTDSEAMDFRRHVIEWLMLHHPHDCPVCDEGGHCLLQDMTIAGGHGIRRYQGKKRTHRDQDLGPLIQHEMNRCIQCYRCTRYYQEFSGYFDLGVMGIGSRVYFGRYRPGRLENPFAGNLIDICPTGVYTDKPSRFFGRRWEFTRGPSVCIHCSLNCSITVSCRYRQVVRTEARFNPFVNGHFICDRGRYGFAYVNEADRPRTARIGEKPGDFNETLAAAMARLTRIAQEFGPQSVAGLGSAQSNLETQTALSHLCRTKGWQGPAFWLEREMRKKSIRAAAHLVPELTIAMGQIEQADFILAIGADPLNEAPILALCMRKAKRSGAMIVVFDPRPIRLPFAFQHLPFAPSALALHLNHLIAEASAGSSGSFGRTAEEPVPEIANEIKAAMAEAARTLGESKRPVIVCGTDIVSETLVESAAKAARRLLASGKQAGLVYLLPAANSHGAALLAGESNASLDQQVEEIEAGRIKALIVVECDPVQEFCDRPRLMAALKKLDLLVVLDRRKGETAKAADIFLPTACLFESGGIFINQEYRAQQARPIFAGGLPISQTGQGGHPPRTFRSDIPGGQLQPAWQTLLQMVDNHGQVDLARGNDILTKLWSLDYPSLSRVSEIHTFPPHGVRLNPPDRLASLEDIAESESSSEQTLELITVDWTFGTESLSAASPWLQQIEDEPCLLIHPDDARALGLQDSQAAILSTPGGSLELTLYVNAEMAKGVVVVPRHRRCAWQQLGARTLNLNPLHLHKKD
jgi:NADH-quinone oxidoreductase subunit G